MKPGDKVSCIVNGQSAEGVVDEVSETLGLAWATTAAGRVALKLESATATTTAGPHSGAIKEETADSAESEGNQ
jgi:hypothetical protein